MLLVLVGQRVLVLMGPEATAVQEAQHKLQEVVLHYLLMEAVVAQVATWIVKVRA